MNQYPESLSAYNERVRQFIAKQTDGLPTPPLEAEAEFNELALGLFRAQWTESLPYRRFCDRRRIRPNLLNHWARIPALPTSAFKDFNVTNIPENHRTAVFQSSGTTQQRPSRHWHSNQSLALYRCSALPWFRKHFLSGPDHDDGSVRFHFLTPSPEVVPHSSLVHMFGAIADSTGLASSTFHGRLTPEGDWEINQSALIERIETVVVANQPVAILGTAFNFVHWLEHLREIGLSFCLPGASRVLETGGYKGRSRELEKAELHEWISNQLGVPRRNIVCEYGMSELSSQAYDTAIDLSASGPSQRNFRFPPWARHRIVSPESGEEVAEGEMGLIQVFDLANAWSILAIQTEDLGIRRRQGFELVGRSVTAESRGCSLMSV